MNTRPTPSVVTGEAARKLLYLLDDEPDDRLVNLSFDALSGDSNSVSLGELRAALAASDRDVLVGENARLRERVTEIANLNMTPKRKDVTDEYLASYWEAAFESVQEMYRAALIPLVEEL